MPMSTRFALNSIALTVLFLSSSVGLCLAHEVSLSKDDAVALKAIMRKDKFLKTISDENHGIAGLRTIGKIASMSIQGPVKLVLDWNDAL